MVSRTTVIRNKSGLHARPASDFIQCASQFTSRIWLKKLSTGDECDGKSIVMLLMLSFENGEDIEIRAEGEDEQQAVDTLAELVDSKLQD